MSHSAGDLLHEWGHARSLSHPIYTCIHTINTGSLCTSRDRKCLVSRMTSCHNIVHQHCGLNQRRKFKDAVNSNHMSRLVEKLDLLTETLLLCDSLIIAGNITSSLSSEDICCSKLLGSGPSVWQQQSQTLKLSAVGEEKSFGVTRHASKYKTTFFCPTCLFLRQSSHSIYFLFFSHALGLPVEDNKDFVAFNRPRAWYWETSDPCGVLNELWVTNYTWENCRVLKKKEISLRELPGSHSIMSQMHCVNKLRH